VSLPAGYSVIRIFASHSGKQIVFALSDGNGGNDLWIANVDASGVARLTRTGKSTYGFWSPDDKYIAYNYNPGAGDDMSSILYCEIRYALPSDRELGPSGGTRFIVQGGSTGSKYEQCDLEGWSK
jgi:hypothetical protein